MQDNSKPRLLATTVLVVIFSTSLIGPQVQIAEGETNVDKSTIDGIIYQERQARISTLGSFVDIHPDRSDISGIWNVDPPLPLGISLFSIGATIDGRVIDSFDNSLCHITSSAEISCWESDSTGTVIQSNLSATREIFGNNSVITSIPSSVALGKNHLCSIIKDGIKGEIYCWGSNYHGQLGSYSGLYRTSPVPFERNFSSLDWTHVASGSLHSCGVVERSEVYCWGSNSLGQLGNAQLTDYFEPTKVVGLPDGEVLLIEAGHFHTCARYENLQTFCWGWNGLGQLGTGDFLDRHEATLAGASDMSGFGSIPMTNQSSLSNTSGNGFSCLVDSDGWINCDGIFSLSRFDNFPTNNPMLNNVPEEIIPGQIRGAPIINTEGHFLISLDSDGLDKSEEVSIFVNYGLDPDLDFWESADESACGTDALDPSSIPTDSDLDGICNRIDQDDDGDGFSDYNDQFPLDPEEWSDKDYDGIGSNSELIEISVPMEGSLYTGIILVVLFISQAKGISRFSGNLTQESESPVLGSEMGGMEDE